MDCLICTKLFIPEREFGNYHRNPQLCAAVILKLFQISNNPDVQGVLEDLGVCQSCHLKLENVWELVTQLEELQRRVDDARNSIQNEMVNSKDVSEVFAISRHLELSKSSLDRLTLLKAIEDGNAAPQGVGSRGMDIQNENENVYAENLGIDESQDEIPHLNQPSPTRAEIKVEIEIESVQGPSTGLKCTSEKSNDNDLKKSDIPPPGKTKAGYALRKSTSAQKRAFDDEESSNEETGSDFESGDESSVPDDDTESERSAEVYQVGGKQPRRAPGSIMKEFTRVGESFQCRHCSNILLDKSSLRRHFLIHGPRNFTCSVQGCGKRFIRASTRDDHVKLVHEKRRDFQCKAKGCGRKFGRKSDLNRHTRTLHEGRRKFKCGAEDCGKAFARKYQLLKHISTTNHKKMSVVKKKKVEVTPRSVSPQALSCQP